MTSPHGPQYRFACPPNWPQPPSGWLPPEGWQPDPAWGPAPEGWHFWQPVAAPAEPPIDGYAVATLITGLLGGVILPVVFGAISLSRIKQGLRRGRVLVVAGWVLTALWLVAIFGYVAWTGSRFPARTPDGTVTRAGKVPPMRLRLGDCLELPESTRGVVKQVDVLPCDSPHNGQVFAIVTLPAGGYPGDDEAIRLGIDACAEEIDGFFGTSAAIAPSLQSFSFTAPKTDWENGDHSVRCLVVDTAGDFTGDVRDR
ncbi:MAG: septum formation family protein [Actinobacteria bacterium]|nr:septum formation family protein [Actinomycetota bacterium]